MSLFDENADRAFVTKDGVHVKPGQLWRDLDKRQANRKVVVLDLGNMSYLGKVLVRNAASPTGTKRWLSVSRMHRHSTGFELVAESPPSTVEQL